MMARPRFVALLACVCSGCVGAAPADDDTVSQGLTSVLDNGTASYSETGSWFTSSGAGYVGTGSRYNGAGTGADEARWQFTVSTTGRYTVDAWWIASSNRVPDAKYRIEHADGTAVVTVDQRTNGSRWNALGTYRFVAGTTYFVRLRDDATAGFVVSADAVRVSDATSWNAGGIASLPPSSELRPLPGGGNGVPSIVSNNPEIFYGAGVLYTNARPMVGGGQSRGGATRPVSGNFSIYVHHISQNAEPADLPPGVPVPDPARYVQVLIANPSSSEVRFSGRFAGWNSDETGGLPVGGSPDYLVSQAFANNTTRTIASTTVPPFRWRRVWSKRVNDNREVDARFAMFSTGPVYVYVISTVGESTTEVDRVINASNMMIARGDIRVSNPPSAYGREAGIYNGDTWDADIALDVPRAGHRIGYVVNTATGTGFSQVQAFPALTNLSDSAREAVGMYGNFYDVTITLRHDGSDSATRTVALGFGSYGAGMPSRFWDGAAWLDGSVVRIFNWPNARMQTLRTYTLAPGQSRTVQLRAMVPGLTSIYQGLWVASQ